MADINYTQLVDSLNNGDLHGQDSWANLNNPNYANNTVQTTIKYLGAKGLYLNGYSSYSRDISATTGKIYWWVKITTQNTSGDGPTIQLRNSTQYLAIIKAIVEGGQLKLKYYSSTTYVNLQNISLNTGYIICIELDQPNNRYRFSVTQEGSSESALGSWVTLGTSGASAMTMLRMGQDSSWASYIDEISPTFPGSAAASYIPQIVIM